MPCLQHTLSQLAQCTLCREELPLEPRPIFQITANAPILIAGQAPGLRAHEEGQPFMDPSGVRLRQWLGVDEQQFYNPDNFLIMPMAFCYPGTGPRNDLPPPPRCAATWRQPLLELLLNIELILTIGSYAQNWHLKGRKYRTMTETIYHWQDYWPGLMPLPHPSPRNNYWFKRNPWFAAELIPVLQERVQQLLR